MSIKLTNDHIYEYLNVTIIVRSIDQSFAAFLGHLILGSTHRRLYAHLPNVMYLIVVSLVLSSQHLELMLFLYRMKTVAKFLIGIRVI